MADLGRGGYPASSGFSPVSSGLEKPLLAGYRGGEGLRECKSPSCYTRCASKVIPAFNILSVMCPWLTSSGLEKEVDFHSILWASCSPESHFAFPWLPNGTFSSNVCVVSLFCNPVSSLFFQSIFYNLTGTITTTSLHLEDALRSLCYLGAWLINLECHVMSMSKEVADGMMNGITITCWTILLIYKISSDQKPSSYSFSDINHWLIHSLQWPN